MAHAGIIRFMSLRNTSQERRLFCSLHPHPKLCKFFAISSTAQKRHGSILQFAAEGDCSHHNESTATAESLWASEPPKKKPAGAAGRDFRRERRSRCRSK